LYLQHTYDQCLGKTPLVKRKLSNFSHGSQIWFKLCVITCEIDDEFCVFFEYWGIFCKFFQINKDYYNSNFGECWTSMHIFNSFISIIKMKELIVWTFPNCCGHIFTTFFHLRKLPIYDIRFEEWKKAKVCQSWN
jgi:hypothetical protein